MLVNEIVPFSIVDGPGNRLVIFVQGCNLNCLYCHNFETINLCIHCGKCIETCPSGALTMIDKKVVYNEELCIDCDQCIFTCPYNSTPKAMEYTVDQIVNMVLSYQDFIDGITFSGGECTTYHSEIAKVAKKLKEHNIEVLVDTNGYFDIDSISDLIENVAGFMIDIKTLNKTKELINMDMTNLENVNKLIAMNKVSELRTVDLGDEESRLTIAYIDELIKENPSINRRINKLAIVKQPEHRLTKLKEYQKNNPKI
ncbi:MAG: YjjW family glycine radical enzyme activase [Erysipelotrichales bacterium]